MTYYKVKKSADQTRKNVNKTDILVANELYTKKELEKFAPVQSVYVKNYFDEVQVSKNKTYFFFGARFSN